MDEWEELIQRYPASSIQAFFRKLTQTRKTGRISESRKKAILKSWQKYDTAAVLSGLDVYQRMHISPTQNEKYVLGIIRNKQRELEKGEKGNAECAGKNFEGNFNGRAGGDNKKDNTGTAADEGERLRQLARGISTAEIECGF